MLRDCGLLLKFQLILAIKRYLIYHFSLTISFFLLQIRKLLYIQGQYEETFHLLSPLSTSWWPSRTRDLNDQAELIDELISAAFLRENVDSLEFPTTSIFINSTT